MGTEKLVLYVFDDKNDNTWYDDGEGYSRWDTDNLTFGSQIFQQMIPF